MKEKKLKNITNLYIYKVSNPSVDSLVFVIAKTEKDAYWYLKDSGYEYALIEKYPLAKRRKLGIENSYSIKEEVSDIRAHDCTVGS